LKLRTWRKTLVGGMVFYASSGQVCTWYGTTIAGFVTLPSPGSWAGFRASALFNGLKLLWSQVHPAVARNEPRVPVREPLPSSGLGHLLDLCKAGRLKPGRDLTWRGGLQADCPSPQERSPHACTTRTCGGCFSLKSARSAR